MLALMSSASTSNWASCCWRAAKRRKGNKEREGGWGLLQHEQQIKGDREARRLTATDSWASPLSGGFHDHKLTWTWSVFHPYTYRSIYFSFSQVCGTFMAIYPLICKKSCSYIWKSDIIIWSTGSALTKFCVGICVDVWHVSTFPSVWPHTTGGQLATGVKKEDCQAQSEQFFPSLTFEPL